MRGSRIAGQTQTHSWPKTHIHTSHTCCNGCAEDNSLLCHQPKQRTAKLLAELAKGKKTEAHVQEQGQEDVSTGSDDLGSRPDKGALGSW